MQISKVTKVFKNVLNPNINLTRATKLKMPNYEVPRTPVSKVILDKATVVFNANFGA